MRGKPIRTVWLVLLFSGLASASQGQTRGQLEVTAIVESSVAWVQGESGNWVFVVANAPDSRDLLSGTLVTSHDRKQEPAKKPGQRKSEPASRQRPKDKLTIRNNGAL
jgi:hypothetical protein